jgi:hypothetical protein
MFLAQFSYDVVWGHKQRAVEIFEKYQPVATELGWPAGVLLEASIGAPESRMIEQYRFESLAELESLWAKLDDPRIAACSEEMGPIVVPGSHRWDIYRVRADHA